MNSLAPPPDGRLLPIAANADGVTVRGVRRSATRLARILDIEGPGVQARAAACAFIEAALAAGCTTVRAEITIGDPASAALRAAGFRTVDPGVHAHQPMRPVRRLEHRRDAAAYRCLPYYAQSTWFTCGPVALMLARRHFDATAPVDRRTEIEIWRHATTVHAARGPGGCDPFGVACAAARMGLQARVIASIEGPFLVGEAYDHARRDLMAFVQAGFRDEARQRGVDIEIRAWAVADLTATLAAGGVAIVLVDQAPFHGEPVPHWVLVHRHVDGRELGPTFVVDDPWVESEDRETDTDRYDLPISWEALDRMAWWGVEPYRAVVLIELPRQCRP